MPASEPGLFRRVLFHGRPVDELLTSLPADRVEARPFQPHAWNLAENEIGVVLFDLTMAGMLAEPPPSDLGEGADRIGVLLCGDSLPAVDAFWKARLSISLPENGAREHLARAIRALFRFLEERAASAVTRKSLTARTKEIESLVGVGIALAAEKDSERLLEKVLTSARALTQADAGSLYLIDTVESKEVLRFVRAQNDTVPFEFEERVLPLDDASIAGFVARNGGSLNLSDVAQLSPGVPYRFDDAFDRKYGYRTRSMLAVPLKTPQGKVLGVLQLINRREMVMPDISTTGFMRIEIRPFDEANEEIARALAAQAAVAVENRQLTESIRNLFEGFVEASVTAIEQRDPTTSGHSERVAKTACALAELASRVETGPYASFRIGREELKELRYAAVLHDFGKVGVREQVLVKARKLPPLRLELLRSRFDQAILSAAAQTWEKAARENWPEMRVAQALASRSRDLEKAWETILLADEPNLLPEEVGAEVQALSGLAFRDATGREKPLVLEEEVAYLAIPQGSLSSPERREIQSHVTQTFRFLSKIPWTTDLARVPDWAYGHHEKLDGSGYPRGLKAGSIPVPVRAITICDIYDALAARDRPYKKAVPAAPALDILTAEARRGAVDADLLNLFVEGKIFERD